MNATTPHVVERWRMERGELTYIGTCPAPRPRAGEACLPIVSSPRELEAVGASAGDEKS